MRLTRFDAYDRLLPSTASISSTRASFAFDEIASRTYGLLRVPHTLPALKRVASPSDEQSNTQRFHDAEVAPMYLLRGFAALVESVTYLSRRDSMRRLADLSAVAHAPSRRRDRSSARPVKIRPLCDLARLPSKSILHQRISFEIRRVQYE